MKYIFTILILLLIPQVALGLQRSLETRFPRINQLSHPPTTTSVPLPAFVQYLYELSVVAIGFVILIAFIKAGVQMMSSAGNPAKFNEGKEHIFQAGIGAVILLTSVLIMNSVNPEIIHTYPQVESSAGVTLYEKKCNQAMDWTDSNRDESRIVTENVSSFDEFTQFQNGPSQNVRSMELNGNPQFIKVLLYGEEDYGGGAVARDFKEPGECYDISDYRSMKLHWNLPGVYACNKAYIEGQRPESEGGGGSGQYYCIGNNAEQQHLSYDIGLLKGNLQNSLKGLRVVPVFSGESGIHIDEPSGSSYFAQGCKYGGGQPSWVGDFLVCTQGYYGVILHEKANFQGKAEVILPTISGTPQSFPNFSAINDKLKNLSSYQSQYGNGEKAFTPLTKAQSITIIPISWTSSEIAGGISFYEKGMIGGSGNTRYPEEEYFTGDANFDTEGDYGNFGSEPFSEVPNSAVGGMLGVNCMDFWDEEGVSAVEVNGDYIVVLFTKKGFEGDAEVFAYNAPDLSQRRMGSCCSIGGIGKQDCASSAIVIPLARKVEPPAS